MSDSIAFDRAAEYYDDTRGLSDDGVRHTTETLAEVFRGAGPVLEVGVGTGQVAIPLHDAGVHVVGVDLSRPMLSKLLAKAGGGPPFPLVEGDATSLPLADEAFAGAYLRWVLHLIPDWQAVVREIARVLAPESAFVAALGAYGGYRQEMQARFAEITGISNQPAGLAWNGWDQLDAEVASAGMQKLPDIRFTDQDRDNLEHFMQAIEGNRFSWTWAVPDAVRREDAAAEVRRWSEDRWGTLSEIPPETFEWRFAVYRRP